MTTEAQAAPNGLAELRNRLEPELARLRLLASKCPRTILMRPDALQALREMCPAVESSNPWFTGVRVIECKWLDKPWQVLPEGIEV